MFDKQFEKMRRAQTGRDPFYLVANIAVPLVVIALLFLSCHHYLTQRDILSNVRTLAIPATQDGAMIEDLVEAVVTAIEEDGRFKVVDEEYADAILYTKVVAAEDKSRVFRSVEITEQYQFCFVAKAWIRSAEGAVLMKGNKSTSCKPYDPMSQESRNKAVAEAVQHVANLILARTTSQYIRSIRH